MSLEEKKSFKDFLIQEGYLIVFAVICLGILSSYMYFVNNVDSESSMEVLGTSSIQGVWLTGLPTKEGCPEYDDFNYDVCVDRDFLRRYQALESVLINMDSNGNILYSNEDILITGFFNKETSLDQGGHLGNLTLRINDRYWVYRDVVFSDFTKDILRVYELSEGYLISFTPSLSTTGLSRQIWMFSLSPQGEVNRLAFEVRGNIKSFLQGTDVDILKKGKDIYIGLKTMDPLLMGDLILDVFEYNKESIHFLNTVLVNNID